MQDRKKYSRANWSEIFDYYVLIHAPRKGSNYQVWLHTQRGRCFNPCSRAGSNSLGRRKRPSSFVFQFTLPVWGSVDEYPSGGGSPPETLGMLPVHSIWALNLLYAAQPHPILQKSSQIFLSRLLLCYC